jgi:MFS family permease
MSLREVVSILAFRRLMMAQLVSVFGDFLAIFGVFTIVSFRMHGSPAEVSGVLLAYMLPQAFVGPAAGVFVDRWDVKRTMVASDVIRALLVLVLLQATSLWEIYGVMMGLSAVGAFFMPAQAIAIRSVVPMEGLVAANAVMMQCFQVTQIVTPGVAALLTQWLGEKVCFWIDSGSFVFSAGMVLTLALARKAAGIKKAFGTVFADLREGVRFIFTHATLAFTIVSMAAGLFAVRCYSALIAVYVRDILHASSGLFGTLGTLIGVGMILGTQFVTRLSKSRSKEHLMMGGLFMVAVGILVLALIGTVVTTVLATIWMGVGVALVVISAQTLMQGQTPMEMLGRVSSSSMSVMALAQAGGLVVSGSIAQVIGIRKSYLATSALLAVIAAVGWQVVEKRAAERAASASGTAAA